MGVSNIQTFKLVLCMYKKLRLHTAILRWRVFDIMIILSLIQSTEVQLVDSEREQWRTVKSLNLHSKKTSDV